MTDYAPRRRRGTDAFPTTTWPTSPTRRQTSTGPASASTSSARSSAWILRIVLCLVFGLPLLFMVVSSFKPDNQIFSDLASIRPSCRSVT